MTITIENKLHCGSIRRKFVLFVSLLILSILTWPIAFLYKVHIHCGEEDDSLTMWQEKYKDVSQEDLNEVLRLYKSTPNLWGHRGTIKNDTASSRIKAQRDWVKQLSSTNFVQHVPSKRMLVFVEQGEGDLYFFTDNKVKCPYAPEFENRCQLVLESTGWRALLKKPKPDSFYIEKKIDAVVGVRNGYWGADLRQPEPQVPPNIQQVYYVYESPCHTGSARLGKTNAWLASYWRGADIPIPYRQVVKHIRQVPVSNKTREYKQIHDDKRNLAVALISNCRFTQNDRLGYIKELNKYISVDTYGGCGTKRCSPGEACIQELASSYKFYLAFENCNCEDYITEKHFVNALQNGMVPVVMGGRLEDYISASPPNSFIHVDNFSTPKDLADYLVQVDNSKELYLSYHAWRYDVDVEWKVTTGGLEDFFCRLCGMLHYYDFQQPPPYPSCFTRWQNLNKCLSRGQWNWGLL